LRLNTLLARYTMNTEPTLIVGELLPMAVAIYGGEWSAPGRQWAAVSGKEITNEVESTRSSPKDIWSDC
jgi:hypothetical protein